MILDMDWNETSNLFTQLNYALDLVYEGYTLAHKLVSFGAYHGPTCDSGPSNWDLVWP